MKNITCLILSVIVFAAILAGCERAMNPVSDAGFTSAIREGMSLKKDGAPITDIVFSGSGFTASVFYDKFTGPDGIVPLKEKKLLVVSEYRDPGPGVFKVKEGDEFNAKDAFSTLGLPFDGPDDLAMSDSKEIYVADGQAQAVFLLAHNGGTPEAFATASSTGSLSFNPFGVAIVPQKFDGPDVDPGDIIVADNAYSSGGRAVWAVNPITREAKILAKGTQFADGPISVAFSSDGMLYVFENNYLSGGTGRIVTLSPKGEVSQFLKGTAATGSMAIHPISNVIYYKQAEGEIWRISRSGGKPELFASKIGTYQDIEFSEDGTTLYVSARTRQQVIQISADVSAWSMKPTTPGPIVEAK